MTFLSVEGLDGAGTTTLTDALCDHYDTVVRTAEPTSGEYGKLVRRNLSDESSYPLIDFYLFMADRHDHIESLIKPSDNSGKLVISDRYADSTRAYQPVSLAADEPKSPFDSTWEAKMFIEHTMARWNYEPDLTLYLDISVEAALERADCDEKYEKRQFLSQVKDNYDALADTQERIYRIDAERSKEEVAEDAIALLNRKI